jgi:NTE family protein
LQRNHHEEACSPVAPEGDERVEPGVALCLSGGGYRAMLFHVGALWRLNELGYLGRLERVSSVSGGSITAGALAARWAALGFDDQGVATNLRQELVEPVRGLAGRTIDAKSILGGVLLPGTVSNRVAAAYRRHLFGDATLQALPDRPRFVINATNLQTGTLWRFSKPYMADYKVGMVRNPEVPIAVAVAASSAFPPVLSPARLKIDPASVESDGTEPHHAPPFTTDVVLSDGGVYDNLGLETAWKRYRTILVSDGGGQMAPAGTVAGDWARHALRVNGVIDNQVRSLRKRQTIAGFQRGDRDGTYWGIRGHVDDYLPPPPGLLQCPPAETDALARTKTRLKAMDDLVQERLINWGYAICDTAMRRWVEPGAAPPGGFPYPASAVG